MFNTKTDDELLVESIDNLLNTIAKRDITLLESILDDLEFESLQEDVKTNIRDSVRNAKDTVVRTNRTVKHKVNNASDHIDNLVKEVKRHIIGSTRDEIITNHTKVSTIIKRVLKTGAVYLISSSGVITLLYLFITTALRKKLTVREREKILADLKLELEICEEKINDATNAGDKKAKYELMRLRNSLKKNIIRVQNAGRGIRTVGLED